MTLFQVKKTVDVSALPTRIRGDAAFVMSQARHIVIHHDRLADYARRLVATCPRVTCLDRDNHFVSDTAPVQTAAYVLALDSINFGSGVFAAAQSAGVGLEYAPVAQSLKAAFTQGRWNEPRKWLAMTAADCHQVFNIPPGRLPMLDRLMENFAQHLRWTAQAVLDDFGNVENMLRDYRGKADALLEKVSSWPHFVDVSSYAGREIAIYKRAQILLADLELALAKPGQAYFGGLDQLTCFADNMVPHVLRTDGILAYSDDLAQRVDKGLEIEADSEMEVELRCAAIHVVELLCAKLGGSYTAVNLDHMLWHRGYEPGFSPYKPHRTITTKY